MSTTAQPAPRRVPPPCWAEDEAQALISAYRDRWRALNRTNLKAADWDDVAVTVARQCPLVSPPKTAVQCRHKMEKLRKRYRSEKQRASTTHPGRFFSSWALFHLMNEMESESASGFESDPDQQTRKGVEFGGGFRIKAGFHSTVEENSSFLAAFDQYVSQGVDTASGFPVKSLGDRNLVPLNFRPKSYGKSSEKLNPKLNLKHGCNYGVGTRSGFVKGFEGCSSLLRSVKEVDPIEEMVSSIELLGEEFVKMEKRKMEMAREILNMRMEMEMKQNQVIMESQQQFVDACVNALLESKKKKKIKVVSPDS